MDLDKQLKRNKWSLVIVLGLTLGTCARMMSMQSQNNGEKVLASLGMTKERLEQLNNDPDFQLALAENYHSGKCLSQDKSSEAVRLRKSIEQETAQPEKDKRVHGYGALQLGNLYWSGCSVQKNAVAAYALIAYSIDMLEGDSRMKRILVMKDDIEKTLSDGQKGDGQTLLKQMEGEKNIFSPIDQYLAKSQGNP